MSRANDFKFQDTSAKVLEKFGASVVEAMEEALLLVEGEAKKNVKRINTGKMRSDINHSQGMVFGEYIGRVGTNSEHFIFHEFGTGEFAENGKGRTPGWSFQLPNGDWISTKGVKPSPMLRPAFRNNKKEIENKFKLKLKKEFDNK